MKQFIKKIFTLNAVQTVIFGFVAVIIIGSVLLNLPIASKNIESVGYIDALFTSTSAVCVTGLVVVDTYTQWSLFGQIIILVLIQIGGLSFMTAATIIFFIFKRKIGLKERLIIVESLNYYNLQGIVKLTKRIIFGTILIEGIGALLLSTRFIREFGIVEGIYKGIFHSISAFCNAGFDIMGNYRSLTEYINEPLVNITIISLIILGGLGFAVWDDLLTKKKFKYFSVHTKMVLTFTVSLLLFGFIIYFIFESKNPNTLGNLSFIEKIIGAFFQTVTPRTAGFNTINQADMNQTSILTTIILMFIGGAPGSTAGGIKVTTFGVMFFYIVSAIRNKEDTEVYKRSIDNTTVLRSFAISFISFFIITITILIISMVEDYSLLEVVFEGVSAFGTVGLSLGITQGLTSISKIGLICLMFLGRVGVLSMVIALSYNNSTKSKHKYPKGKILIG